MLLRKASSWASTKGEESNAGENAMAHAKFVEITTTRRSEVMQAGISHTFDSFECAIHTKSAVHGVDDRV